MQETEGIRSSECRELIRRRAFELADSGIFDGWEAIRRALCSRFHVAHLEQIFSSPFCRMDIDQRCRTARMGGLLDRATPAANDDQENIEPHLADRCVRPSSQATGTRGQKGYSAAGKHTELQGLAEAIAALLADERELTATQMARQLGAGQREVQRALREMLARHEVRVARRTPHSVGGRPARIFAGGPMTGDNSDICASSCWPRADPLVLRVMDTFARHG